MRSNSLFYSLKIWGTALLIAPALNLVVADFIRPPYNGGAGQYILDQLSAYFFTAFFAGIFSVITWLLLFLVIQIIIRVFPLKVYVKYIIMVTGVLLTLGTFYAVFGWLFHTRDEYFPFMIFTYLCIAGGAYFYNLKIENESGSIEI